MKFRNLSCLLISFLSVSVEAETTETTERELAMMAPGLMMQQFITSCPPDLPSWGADCSGSFSCEYGTETCCGETHPSLIAVCSGGMIGIMHTEACFMRHCPTPAPQKVTPSPTPLPKTCPAEVPEPNEPCAFLGECEYGEEKCCGETHPNYKAECLGGKVALRHTDACMHKVCNNPCQISSGWCKNTGSYSKYSFADCDGDGLKDHICVDQRKNRGVIFSGRDSCKDTWPAAPEDSCRNVFGCPAGYERKTGDKPGWSDLGSIKNLETSKDCADRCNAKAGCLSFEYSPTALTCNLNNVRLPTITNSDYDDYLYCSSTTEKVTPSPTPAPTPAKETPSLPNGNGDPHFTTFGGEHFDFHGECDLVLFTNPGFADGLGLDVHVRTMVDDWYSYIESAAVRIGDETLELKGGKHNCTFWFNGKPMGELEDGQGALGGFPLFSKRVNDYHGKIRIDLIDGNALSVESYRDFVRVNVGANNSTGFEGSIGILGAYPSGQRLARDRKTLIEDVNEFGQEWQVLASEPKLFHRDGAIRPPMKCLMPNEGKISKHMMRRRRLGEAGITRDEAIEACARVVSPERSECIFDVLTTQDKDMALSHTLLG